MDTLTPPRAPNGNGTRTQLTPRVITSTMGDGYVSDVPDGLNAVVGAMTLEFTLTPAEADAMEDWLRSHVGQSFYYTLPGSTTTRKWVWKQFSRSPNGGTAFEQVSVALEERFTAA